MAKTKARSDLSFLFTEWFQPFRLGWKKTSVFITQNGVVLINISCYKEKNSLSVQVGAKTDSKENISPTDRTDVGRQNLCRLLAAGCRWRFGVGTVTADRRPVGGRRLICTVLILIQKISSYFTTFPLFAKD
jgi:hypothetical protein